MTLSSHTQPLDDGTTITGTIVFGGAAAVDDTITITDAAGTTKVFTAKGSTSAGDLEFISTDAAAAATAPLIPPPTIKTSKIFSDISLIFFSLKFKIFNLNQIKCFEIYRISLKKLFLWIL